MTDDWMSVQPLLGKQCNADFLRKVIGFAAQRLMDLEVFSLTGTGCGEKSSDWLTQRLPRPELAKRSRHGRTAYPQLRTSSYYPAFLETRRLAEKR